MGHPAGVADGGKGRHIAQPQLCWDRRRPVSPTTSTRKPYVSPYSIQFNGGVQHEFANGMMLSVDYVHNATIKIPRSVDVNRDGAARTLNNAAATNAIKRRSARAA